jgi:hypothetical protein
MPVMDVCSNLGAFGGILGDFLGGGAQCWTLNLTGDNISIASVISTVDSRVFLCPPTKPIAPPNRRS